MSQLILYSWDREFAEWLLENGCEINRTALDRQTLLSDAASSNNTEAVDFLFAHGIDLSYTNSALCWAIIHNSVDAARLLLDKGASLDEMYASCKGIEKSLYHSALTRESTKGKGRVQLVQLLISRGVDFSKEPERAISVGIDKTKLLPRQQTVGTKSRGFSEVSKAPKPRILVVCKAFGNKADWRKDRAGFLLFVAGVISPLDYAKVHLQKWPDAAYIAKNITIVESARTD